MKTYLQVPFAEKDEAKRLGAKFEAGTKRWYVENIADLRPFMRWVSNRLSGAERKGWSQFLKHNDKRHSRLNNS